MSFERPSSSSFSSLSSSNCVSPPSSSSVAVRLGHRLRRVIRVPFGLWASSSSLLSPSCGQPSLLLWGDQRQTRSRFVCCILVFLNRHPNVLSVVRVIHLLMLVIRPVFLAVCPLSSSPAFRVRPCWSMSMPVLVRIEFVCFILSEIHFSSTTDSRIQSRKHSPCCHRSDRFSGSYCVQLVRSLGRTFVAGQGMVGWKKVATI